MPDITPAAPAQPAPSAPVTAVHQAVAANDFAAFETAERAALSGKPLPSAAGEPPAPVAEPPSAPVAEEPKAPALSKRQQDINDRIRRSVAEATREKDAEIARLQALVPKTDPAKPEAPAPPVERFPDYASYLDIHPDATLEQWMDARDEWRDAKRVERDRAEAARGRRDAEEHYRAQTYTERVNEAMTADPQFLDGISPEVLALKPRAALTEGERATALNVLADEIFESPLVTKLMQHFTAHHDDLERIAALPNERAVVREFGKIEKAIEDASSATPAAPGPPKPKTIPSAPAPPVNLGNRTTSPADPSKSAVQANDYAAFEQAEFQKLAGARR